jgi:nuclease S1
VGNILTPVYTTQTKSARWLRSIPKRLLAAAAAIGVGVPAAFGWGDAGHHIVANVAGSQLTAKTRNAVNQLLHGRTLESVSTFADHYRLIDTNTAPWHFVDIPVAATSYDQRRDCEAHHGCVVGQLEHFKKVLADQRASRTNRVFALMFVVHLVGDLHQPLHCADNNDRGGNDVKVEFLGETNSPAGGLWNLHAVWDSGLIEHRGLIESKYARKLITGLTPGIVSAMQAGTTIDWALQSHSNAVRFAYVIPADHKLGPSYTRKVRPVLDDSLLKGGLRLARVLNEALGQ